MQLKLTDGEAERRQCASHSFVVIAHQRCRCPTTSDTTYLATGNHSPALDNLESPVHRYMDPGTDTSCTLSRPSSRLSSA
jgi:hypothetical protein